MHLLATATTTLDEIGQPIDLAQPPGDLVVLSFADSDLRGLAAAWALERHVVPSLRLASLKDLRHPMSVDLWIERVATHAKVILVRLLGGLDWWRYGIEQLSSLARERGIALAVLPGEDRDDRRLAEYSTLPLDELDRLLGFFREGGSQNLRSLLRQLARRAGVPLEAAEPQPMARMTAYLPGDGAVDLDAVEASVMAGHPVVVIIFYRSALLVGDTAPIDALCQALRSHDLAPAPLVVNSLKDPEAVGFVRSAVKKLRPSIIITATAFAAGGDAGEPTPLDQAGVPVLQVVIATTRRSAWLDSSRGLGASDLAMHVVLPELDGRILAGAIAFKDPLGGADELAFSALGSRPEPDRIAVVAARAAALVHLQKTPPGKRRAAVVIPDYPGAPGRTGYAVGLDVPASVLALLTDLTEAGYHISDVPRSSRELLEAVRTPAAALPLDVYHRLLAGLPATATGEVLDRWGDPGLDPDVTAGAFHFRAVSFGHIIVALAPDRGRRSDRRADYHDPTLPPRHALLAFCLWLRHVVGVDALIHMGAHGTLEWLPGKGVALTSACFPEIAVGPLPVIYPFLVSNPGEAAQAKRRIAAVTIGHLPPPLVAAPLRGDAQELERLVDEYVAAEGFDHRRRVRLAGLIVERAQHSGAAREAGVDSQNSPEDALRRIDAWLCDLKELTIKDGLHVYGRAPRLTPFDALWEASAEAERVALLAALEGRRIAPGPAGAPSRGRRDVLPTGRNLFTHDPRMLPTPTAMDLGRLASEEVIRNYLQAHGEMPRALVVDLWASATLRTGGEEIAQCLAYMGCRPIWDLATGRITGVEVLPMAAVGRPRIDVTCRISGLFRDLFPAQIALIDAAVHAVAVREEADDENPLAAAVRSADAATAPTRIYGTAPGAYGAGVEDLLDRDSDVEHIGRAYLDAASHSYGNAEGDGIFRPGAFAACLAAADLLVHPSDDPARDLLEGAEDASFVGGFAAATALFGRKPDLVMLDATNPQRPRARLLGAALRRIVLGRAIHPDFITGQMRHGPRGAAEFAETVDRLAAFAYATDAVPTELFDALYEVYVADPAVREFLIRENQAAARAIADRFESLRGRGLWHPRRNDIDADLASLRTEPPPDADRHGLRGRIA